MLGLRDYVEKNGFQHVVLGLSGGIDSALVACLAVDALGAERVSAAIMPSPYSSAGDPGRRARARRRARRARPRAADRAGDGRLRRARCEREFAGRAADLTEENLQARIRGNLLMALSNKFGWLVLTTGNKSEMSVGYTHPLRRPRRRLRGHQGRAQDARLPPVRVAQLAGRRLARRARRRGRRRRRAPDPPLDHRARALGRAAPRPARRGLAAAVRAARPDPRRATSSSTRAASS